MRCPLYPQKQTSLAAMMMSALCQKAVQKYDLIKKARLWSQINKSLRLQLRDTYHATFVGDGEARQQIFE